jgi:RNA polymerase sigma-70 factor (ECF subfamily)
MRPLAVSRAGSPKDPPASAVSVAACAGPAAPFGASAAAGAREARLRQLIDSSIDFVARVLRNAGAPEAEIDDEVQHTFIIAARRLDDVRLGSERSFLLGIALNLAAHARRTVARRREVGADQVPELIDGGATADHLTDRKRARRMLDEVLDQMDPDLRTVLVLAEFEEMSMSEIAGVLEIPQGTVASRLRRARVVFRERVGLLEALSKREGES